jgi:hypothetical protein
MVRFMAPSLYSQGNGPRYPLNRRLGGPQNRSGLGGEEKNSQTLPGLEPVDHLTRSPTLYHSAIMASPVFR